MLRYKWPWAVVSLVTVAVLVVWLVGREPEVGGLRWTLTLLIPLLISGYGLRKRSLDASGAALAVVVGFLLTAASACFSACLLVFFITSSQLTKWKAAEKRKLEEDYKEGCTISVFAKVSKYSDTHCLLRSVQVVRGTGCRWCAMEEWPVCVPSSTWQRLA